MIKDVIELISMILVIIIYLFYRENIILMAIAVIYVWIRVVMKYLYRRKENRPKALYYIKEHSFYGYFRLVMFLLSCICVILGAYKIVVENKSIDNFIFLFCPLMALSLLDTREQIYFYNDGIVHKEDTISYANIYKYSWFNENTLKVFYKEDFLEIKIPINKMEEVKNILIQNLKDPL